MLLLCSLLYPHYLEQCLAVCVLSKYLLNCVLWLAVEKLITQSQRTMFTYGSTGIPGALIPRWEAVINQREAWETESYLER